MATIIFSFLLLLITHLAAAFEGDDDIGQLTDFFQFRTVSIYLSLALRSVNPRGALKFAIPLHRFGQCLRHTTSA